MGVGEGGVAGLGDVRRLVAVEAAREAAAEGDRQLRRVTALACRLLDVDLGFVSLVGPEQEVLTAVSGAGAGSVPATLSTAQAVCAHLVTSRESMLVPDLLEHPVLRDLVEVRVLGLRSYAGTPLLSASGHVLGGLCVGHSTPRTWTESDARLLADLAGAVQSELQLRAAVKELQELARSDALTGTANRRAFDERLHDELHRSRRHGHHLSLLLLDVDHFKDVNDEQGHDAGDRVLGELAGRVRQQLRDSDLLARLGGDEFAVLLPETDEARGRAAAERVRRAVAGAPLAGRSVTVSIGAAVVAAGAASPQRLARAADDALYQAKAAGRDAVVLATLDQPGPDRPGGDADR